MRGRVGDIVNGWESIGDLVARGYEQAAAEECVAMGVFLRRARDEQREPEPADVDYARGALAGRAYLEQVAPEELNR